MCSFLRRGVGLWCDNGCVEDRVLEQEQTSRLSSMIEFEMTGRFRALEVLIIVVPASLGLCVDNLMSPFEYLELPEAETGRSQMKRLWKLWETVL